MKQANLLVCAVLCLLCFNKTQGQGKEIKWSSQKSWQYVLNKAKAENKFIFVDCFATWCAPCKKMDASVFNNDSVTGLLDEGWISVRLQMDSTQHDDEQTMGFYSTARIFENKYDIKGLPSFLFFSSDGVAVHKAQGLKSVKGFIKTLKDAEDTTHQYYTLLKKYQTSARLSWDEIKYLALMAQGLEDTVVTRLVGNRYVASYLEKLPPDSLYSKENLLFIYGFTRSTEDPGFHIFYDNQSRVDKAMNIAGLASGLVERAITHDEVTPVLIEAVKPGSARPNWKVMTNHISKKFGDPIAEKIVSNAKERFYEYQKDWVTLHQLYIKRYRKHGINVNGPGAVNNPDGVTNNMAWDIYEHSLDPKVVSVAVAWMKKMVELLSPEKPASALTMDTYACLLYKQGRRKEAIAWESKVVDLYGKSGDVKGTLFLQNTLQKMKDGKLKP